MALGQRTSCVAGRSGYYPKGQPCRLASKFRSESQLIGSNLKTVPRETAALDKPSYHLLINEGDNGVVCIAYSLE
jgi:hypothetical protein